MNVGRPLKVSIKDLVEYQEKEIAEGRMTIEQANRIFGNRAQRRKLQSVINKAKRNAKNKWASNSRDTQQSGDRSSVQKAES